MGVRPFGLALLVAACSLSSAATAPPKPPGETAPPASTSLRLPRTFVPIGYRAHLAIDPRRPTFDGRLTIHGKLTEASSSIWLHGRKLVIYEASATREGAGSSIALAFTSRARDWLELQASTPLEPGLWHISIRYSGELDEHDSAGAFRATVDGLSYVYTQFEPVFARRVFPCVDEPDSKVPWQLTLDVPSDLEAVSNTAVARTLALPDGGTRHEFERSLPLPSYLVAFGVGPFDIVDAPPARSGVPVRIVTPRGRGADAAYAAKTTPRLLDLLEEWFELPYPYGKLDILTLPLAVGFEAMENAGLVTFAESSSLFDEHDAAWQRRHSFTRIAAHELAHQWFGDYVTPAWWDDIWLNEGFANWMELEITAQLEPGWHDELASVDMRSLALEADSLSHARSIRQPLETPDDIFNVFDEITYYKGASVLGMLESYLGSSTFRRGVHQYLKSRALGNATSTDFVKAMSESAGTDLAPALASFLDQSGAPELEARLECGVEQPRLVLSQRPHTRHGSSEQAPNRAWTFPVCVAFDSDGKRAEACTLLDGTGSITLDSEHCPRWVMPNVGGRGYYRASLTTPEVTALRDLAWPALTGSERRALFYDVSGAGRSLARGLGTQPTVPPLGLPLALSLVPKLLVGGDRFTVGDAVALPTALDRMIPDELRPQYEHWMQRTFSHAAHRVGILPRDEDDLDAESVRLDLLRAAAWLGRDPKLVAEAVVGARAWRELPEATRSTVLMLAADSEPTLFSELERSVRSERDRARRREMLSALAAVRDPRQVSVTLELIFELNLDFRETLMVLLGTSTEATRQVAERFFREHQAAIMQGMPREDVLGVLAVVMQLFTSSCDASRRADVVAHATTHFASRPGGKHVVDEAIEAMDQCIAARTVLSAQIRDWLRPVQVSAD
jgi:alanyl aminopeptidase